MALSLQCLGRTVFDFFRFSVLFLVLLCVCLVWRPYILLWLDIACLCWNTNQSTNQPTRLKITLFCHRHLHIFHWASVPEICVINFFAFTGCNVHTLDGQVVLNAGVSKTSKIRVFNSAVLIALSRLYVWGSANVSVSHTTAAKKRRPKRAEAFHFANVCMLISCILLRWNSSEVLSKTRRALSREHTSSG